LFFPALAVVFLLCFWLARTSNLIRDLGPEPEGPDGEPLYVHDEKGEKIPRTSLWKWIRGEKDTRKRDKQGEIIYKQELKPYSLASTQLAFWLFIIASSISFIWTVTTNRQSLNSFALGILGISSATTLGSVFIDAGKRTSAEADRQAGLAKLRDLQAQEKALSIPP